MTDASSQQYRQEKTYKEGSSAHYAYLFVPEDKKQVIQTLYAFLREVTDILYVASDSSIARIKLAWWKAEIDRLFAHQPEHPISQALVEPIQQYGLAKQYFQYIIESVEMDLNHNRYVDWSSLKKFCTMQSGAFACLIAQVLAGTHESTLRFAQHLGVAIQYTHLLRQVGQDAAQGRIYLPMDFLREHNLKAADILNGKHTPEFKQCMQAQMTFAHQLFQEAFMHLDASQRKALRPCLIKANLSLKLLHSLSQKDWQVFDHSISLPPLRKLFTATKVWISQGRFFGWGR
ncbi:squalene/phytoene synthase family protein [Pelistega europaea]|uniref:Squalene/phytoene synthase family protein n=1 Tax=Pelistega europaea TaxID=106147 RepID=A0A7Y4LD49_9BURK|nr:squalene/phytoene synthase family protein [Pelistega europaea]NOL50257.1 squalene/phytoene synthase family protein [Pelistega europaea]